MNKDQQDAWKNEVLDLVFEAIAGNAELRRVLVFKGARVLSRRLVRLGRQSYDIDSNLTDAFVRAYPSRVTQREFVETALRAAIERHFESQPIVRFRLEGLRVIDSPPALHPRGWNAFKVRLRIGDLGRANTIGLPRLELDVAAPERLRDGSVATLRVGSHEVSAYSVPRSAGEKCRAFLSSLPAYAEKTRGSAGAVRVKDLYDISRILAEHPIEESEFWREVGTEFRLACESRAVDCHGLDTFAEQFEVTAATYASDPTIPKEVPFIDAWASVERIVRFFEQEGVVPISFPWTARNDE